MKYYKRKLALQNGERVHKEPTMTTKEIKRQESMDRGFEKLNKMLSVRGIV